MPKGGEAMTTALINNKSVRAAWSCVALFGNLLLNLLLHPSAEGGEMRTDILESNKLAN